MYSSYFLLFFLSLFKTNISFAKIFNFVNNFEDLITISFIKNLEVKYCIYVKNFNEKKNDLENLKKFSGLKIPANIFSYNELNLYWEMGAFPNVKKAIVVKDKNMTSLIRHFQDLQNKNLAHLTHHFIWLVFVEFSESLKENLEFLSIPYNCQFIISYPINNSTYKLMEVYKVKSKTFYTEYGRFSNDQLLINENYLYLRRMNLNGTIFEVTVNDINELDWFKEVPREKRQTEILSDISKIMNIQYSYQEIGYERDESEEKRDVSLKDMFAFPMPFHSVSYSRNFVGPLFVNTINWYVKYPKFEVHSNYYIKPFHPRLWKSIFGFLLIGSLFGVLVKVTLNSLVIPERISTLDLAFLGLESFCNQIGCAVNLKKSSIRLLTITFRLAALYVIPSYSSTIISCLTVKIMHEPFRNLEEFVENEKYTLGLAENSFLTDYLKRSTDVTLRRIYENYSWRVNGISPPQDFHDKFCSGELVYTFLDNDIRDPYWKEYQNCEIYKIANPITFYYTGVFLGANSPFKEVFNYNVLKFYTSGFINELQKLTQEPSIPTTEPDDDFKPVDIGRMVQVFSIIGIGSILAGIVLLFEFFFQEKNAAGGKEKEIIKNNKTGQ